MNIPQQNPLLSPSLGWLFVVLSCLFVLGLLPRLARIFYTLGAGIAARAAAPMLFALLAAACFGGCGIEALGAVAIVGIVVIVTTRAAQQRHLRSEKNRI